MTKSGSGKWFILSGFIILALSIWFGGWVYAARTSKDAIVDQLAKAGVSGLNITCENMEVRGFPFRLGFFCDRIEGFDTPSQSGFEAGAFRTTALLHIPRHVIVELDAPMLITRAGELPLVVHWSTLRSSIRTKGNWLERASTTFDGMEIQFPRPLFGGASGVEIKMGELHLRSSPENPDNSQDIAFILDGVSLVSENQLISGLVSIAGDVQIDNSIRNYVPILSRFSQTPARNQPVPVAGQIRKLTIKFNGESIVQISGPITIAPDGSLSGEILLAVTNPSALQGIIANADPEIATAIEPVLSNIKSFGKSTTINQKPAREIVLNIQKNEVSLGLIRLGTLPFRMTPWRR